jgi:GH25 family lysozyme M1 (1,4-beta-N-acetylmuramidase)
MSGVYGADVSTAVNATQWKALIEERGITFGVVRCYMDVGKPDPNAPSTIKAAWEAGLAAVDVYHFPDCRVGAREQVEQSVKALRDAGVTFGRFWFDVEDNSYWSTTDHAANVKFLHAMIQAAIDLRLPVGVYTIMAAWEKYMGNDTSFSSYPLWYASLTGPTFDDAQHPRGGWTAPMVKQFKQNEKHGGVVYDGNWSPDNSWFVTPAAALKAAEAKPSEAASAAAPAAPSAAPPAPAAASPRLHSQLSEAQNEVSGSPPATRSH